MLQNDEIDILIVGSGLAGTSLAVELIERLHGLNLGRQPRIYVVEKSRDFGGGLAYHKDVAPEFLLNDQLRITDCADFEQWLQETKSTWHTELKETGSQATQDWLEEHDDAIENSDLGDLHMPRTLFGDFMRVKVDQSRDRARRLGCHLEYRHDTVTGIALLSGGGFEIKLQYSGVVRAAIAVLAVGAVPKRRDTEFGVSEGYFDGIYRCDLSELTNRLESLLSNRPANERRILIKGGNATAAEFIYFLSFTPSLASQISELIVATPGGKLLPAAVGTEKEPYEPEHLQAISKMSYPTADALWRALESDFKYGYAHRYTVLDNVDHTLDAFRTALNALPSDEQLRWVIYYGDRQQELVRRVPNEYFRAAEQFRSQQKLSIENGRVTDIVRNGGSLLSAQIATSQGHKEVTTPVIVDCTGFGCISTTQDPLLSNLRDPSGISLSANATDKGFHLQSTFEASENLFVLGPLMTGYSGPNTHIWHLQNIHRIRKLAPDVASKIATRLRTLSPPSEHIS